MLIWSFEALWIGEEPTVDWKGKAIEGAVAGVNLMNGKFMAVWALICDLEHASKCYQMPSPSGNCPCGLCPVISGALPWLVFRPDAGWLDHVNTITSWLASGWKRSKIFMIRGVQYDSTTETEIVRRCFWQVYFSNSDPPHCYWGSRSAVGTATAQRNASTLLSRRRSNRNGFTWVLARTSSQS